MFIAGILPGRVGRHRPRPGDDGAAGAGGAAAGWAGGRRTRWAGRGRGALRVSWGRLHDRPWRLRRACSPATAGGVACAHDPAHRPDHRLLDRHRPRVRRAPRARRPHRLRDGPPDSSRSRTCAPRAAARSRSTSPTRPRCGPPSRPSRRRRAPSGRSSTTPATPSRAPSRRVSMDDLRRQFETNVFGLVRMCQLVLPGHARQGRRPDREHELDGRNFTFPGGGAYHATKYAVEAISDALRFEVKGFGVGVTVIQPGAIRTEFANTVGGGDCRRATGPTPSSTRRSARATSDAYEKGPLARLGGEPDDVAKAVEKAITAQAGADPRARDAVRARARHPAPADARPRLGRVPGHAVQAPRILSCAHPRDHPRCLARRRYGDEHGVNKRRPH